MFMSVSTLIVLKTKVCLLHLTCLVIVISLFQDPQKSKDHKAKKIALFSLL